MEYIYKITPNNKTIIINQDVLINGYDEVPYVNKYKDEDLQDFIIDPCTFKYKSEDEIYISQPYPIDAKFKITRVYDVPWYGDTFIPDYNNLNLTLDNSEYNRLKGSYGNFFDFEFSVTWSDGGRYILSDNSDTFRSASNDLNFWLDGVYILRSQEGNPLVFNDSSIMVRHRTGYILALYAYYRDPVTQRERYGYDTAEIWQQGYTGDIIDVSMVEGIYPLILDRWFPHFSFYTYYVKPRYTHNNSSLYNINTFEWTAMPDNHGDFTYTYDGSTNLYYLNACDENGNITNSVRFEGLVLEQSNLDNSSVELVNFLTSTVVNIGKTVSDVTNLHQFIDAYNNKTLINNQYVRLNTNTVNISYTNDISVRSFYRTSLYDGTKNANFHVIDENHITIDISIFDSSNSSIYNLLDLVNIDTLEGLYQGQDSVLRFRDAVPVIDIKMHYSGYVQNVCTYEDQLYAIQNPIIYDYNAIITKNIDNGLIDSRRIIDTSINQHASEQVEITPVGPISPLSPGLFGNRSTAPQLLGTHTTIHNNTYTLKLSYKSLGEYNNSISKTSEPDVFAKFIYNNLRINGVKVSSFTDYDTYRSNMNIATVSNDVYPGIYSISVDNMPNSIEGIMDLNMSGISGQLLFTNSENQKDIITYDNIANPINSEVDSYMLLKTDPKLTGNIKLVVDTSYNLYLDTFKVTEELSKSIYRKYPVSYEGNYPRDVKEVFGKIQMQELYKVPEQSLDPKRYYTNFNDQYLTMYEYGAETNDDNMYSENMKILAPLHIGKRIPDFFAIFRYEGTYNPETYQGQRIQNTEKFKELLKSSKIVKTYDLRTWTSIGQYLNNYKDMLKDYLYGQTYLQFIEQDNVEYSNYYRQGKNNWKGILVDKGILGYKSEISYFISKELDKKDKNVQETLNDYIIKGFERNNIVYPNIINLEFMFNDNTQDNYSMHRYFGLYLTKNDIINYDCIIKDNPLKNEVVSKLDVSGNIINDQDIVNLINSNKYDDRIFYLVTNTYADRVQNVYQYNTFLNNNVINKPLDNVCNIKSEQISFGKVKSFITLTFSKPVQYGEHLKFVALNVPKDNKSIIDASDYLSKDKQHIVFEIIGSNDIRLADCDDCINPYIATQRDEYADNTLFYRITFYTQDVNDPSKEAAVPEQIYRIIRCIKKFNHIIKVQSYNEDTISVVSNYDEMYFQHIDKLVLGELDIDLTNLKYSTDTSYNTYKKINYYTQITDGSTYIDLKDAPFSNDYYQYIDYDNPKNIKDDSILYFNRNIKTKMHALSNESRYFEPYYAAFANYSFEFLGWRYQNIVRFVQTSDLNFSYSIYTDIEDMLKDVKYPLIHTVDKDYQILDKINITYGYVNCTRFDEDATIQKYIFDVIPHNVVINPFNVNFNMICSYFLPTMNNNSISLYKPKWAKLAIMGISQVKDLDTTVELDRNCHRESCLTVRFSNAEKVKIDESDYRLQQGVVYKLVSGGFDGLPNLNKGENFIIIGRNVYVDDDVYTLSDDSLTALGDNTVIQVNNKYAFQEYNFDTSIPTQHIRNFYMDINNTDSSTSEFSIPVVPATNCLWKSNGTYMDQNQILDTSLLINKYNVQGIFTENAYTPADYEPNQYSINKIEDIITINGEYMSFRDAILNNKAEHIIKQFLVNHVNIKTAVGYYNSNIQTFEFVFNGAKFVMKVSDRYYQPNIHLSDYNNYEVYILNDYDLSKNNEVYISTVEEIILIINHQFYIDYAREADNNIIKIDGRIIPYAPYSSNYAPYEIKSETLTGSNNTLNAAVTDKDKSSFDLIDPLNTWSSYFVQYDIPSNKLQNAKPMFIYNSLTTLMEYGPLIGFINVTDAEQAHSGIQYKTGMLKENDTVTTPSYDMLDYVEESEPFAYILSKADGKYNYHDESGRTKLKRYAKSFDVDTDYYIISENSYEQINVTDDYKAILLDVTVPNRIKYNFGYFTPATVNIVDFETKDDELNDKLKINLLLSNTNVKNVNDIPTYTGNKVYTNNRGYVKRNYFVKYNHSPLSSNWDADFYREYTDETHYKNYNGYLTGIDDKSFFGSRCMVVNNNYIKIDNWNPYNQTNITHINDADSTFNVKVVNVESAKIEINVTQAIYNYFLNNDNFIKGWDEQYVNGYISIKNYIDLTMNKFYNMSSGMQLVVYKKDNYDTTSIIMHEVQPDDLNKWGIYENFESKFETRENELYLTAKFDMTNIEIYPILKIYKK